MADVQESTSFDVECPHCRKPFTGKLIEGGAARYRGFKCPHCKLFVPAAHGTAHVEPLTQER